MASHAIDEGEIAAKPYSVTEQEAPGTVSIDFLNLWGYIFRSRFWIAGIVVACMLLALIITFLMTPMFEAKATVQIDQEAVKIVGTEDSDATAAIQDADRFLRTQIDILKSRDLAIRVARDNDFLRSETFLERMGVDEDIDPVPGFTPEQLREKLIILTIQENLYVSLPVDSRVATISFESPDAVLAATVANSYADNFIRSNLQRKVDTSAYAREFLLEQLEAAKGRLEQSERDANEYAQQSRIIETATGPDGERRSTLTSQSLVQLNEAYTRSLSNRIAEEKKWRAIANLPVMSIPQVNENIAIQRLLEQRGVSQSKLDAERATLGPAHPTVQRLQAEVEQLTSQVEGLATNIRGGLRSAYDSAIQEEASLRGQLEQLQQAQLDEQSASVRLNTLSRESGTNRVQYEALLSRYRQLDSEAGVQSNNVSIVDRAEVPVEPVRPILLLNLAIGSMLGVILSLIFVFLREQIFDRVRSLEDIERKIALPVLGITPLVEGQPIDYLQDPKSELAESYAAIRSALSHTSSTGLPKVTSITSATASEGKSTSCLAIAANAARFNKRVLVIDADLRRPQQHALNGMQNDVGLASVLTGNAKANEAIKQIDDSSLYVMPTGPIPPNPVELLASDLMRQLVEESRASFDHVFIDSPPVYGLADAIELANVSDKTIFAILSGKNKAATISKAVDRIFAANGSIVGCILTGFDAKELGYGENYGYYTYSYGK